MKYLILHILNSLVVAYTIYQTFCNESLMLHPRMLTIFVILLVADISVAIINKKNKSILLTSSLLLFFTIAIITIITRISARNINVEPWQTQCEYAKRLTTAVDSCKIKFIGRGKKQMIRNEEEKNKLLEKMFGPDAVIAEKNIICSIEEMKHDTVFFEKVMLIKKKVEPLIHIGTETMEMEWEYKGKHYFTTSILSSTGSIVYDNIGTMGTGRCFHYSSDNF